jgi:asparagine synthase (glutamine-hydrolysing)
MCGIAGWIAAADTAPDQKVLHDMLDSIEHRGPDGQGTSFLPSANSGQQVALGHRRLAIIDPHGAPQPMHDDAVGLTLVFNGEIYNFRELRRTLTEFGYRFERDSDTEVLLRAYRHWGPAVVDHLRGMFAFAIWDARFDRLLLARDRFGEKPLFLHQHKGDLYFASEIKALLQHPRIRAEVDKSAVWDYLAYRYVPAPATLFRGIRKLMPGTTLLWERGEISERRYWSSADRLPVPHGHRGGSAVTRFLEHLDESVRLQMVSDVPYGAFLSGGLDSSTIVALMRRHSDEVRTFSVGFGDSNYSELPYASEVASALGTRHHEIVVSEQHLMDSLPSLVRFRDAPVSEPSDIPMHLLACEAAKSVKMVLTGEGSDELLGGYPKHLAENMVGGWQRIPGVLRKQVFAPLIDALPYRYRRAKTALTNLNIADNRERYVRWFGALSVAERKALTRLSLGEDRFAGEQFATEPMISPLRRILYFDQSSWLPDNLLERTDRMTMAASIEARVPFLDYRLAEFVASLPDHYRVRGRVSKWILRKAAEQLIPRSILRRPKVGFRVPVNDWFRGPMRNYLLDHLQSPQSLTRDYYDSAALGKVLDEHLGGRHNHEKLLWSLLNLEIWHRQYV